MDPFQSSTPCACYDCGINTPIILFTPTKNRFCFNCILKQNKGIFCPICFKLFTDSFLPNLQIMCFCCPSVAHLSCVLSSTADSSFTCPSCIDHNFKFRSAAQIAVNSMNRAVAVARLYVEKRAMESAKARKMAIEVLEKFSTVVPKEEGTSKKK